MKSANGADITKNRKEFATMAENFVVSKKVKETKTGTTITIDIKKTNENSTTISGDIEEVVEELKKLTEEK